jgi:hypothetical protein
MRKVKCTKKELIKIYARTKRAKNLDKKFRKKNTKEIKRSFLVNFIELIRSTFGAGERKSSKHLVTDNCNLIWRAKKKQLSMLIISCICALLRNIDLFLEKKSFIPSYKLIFFAHHLGDFYCLLYTVIMVT